MKDEIVTLSSAELARRFDPDSRITEFCVLLRAENRRINLVSRETSDADMERLALDSLAPLAFLEDAEIGSYLDIGSGGGLPAFPLLLSGRVRTSDERCPVLVERAQKKAAALRRIAIALGVRIEPMAYDLAQAKLPHVFDLITMRYVKLTPALLAIILPLLSEGGGFVYYSKSDIALDPSLASERVVKYMIDSEQPVRTLTIISRA